MNTQRLLPYAVCIGLSLGAGFIGSYGTMESISSWYQTLTRPSWTPPDFVFGPVWTLLYVLMGIAAALVWQSVGKLHSLPLLVFFAHLVVNALWSLVFFGAQQIGLALGVIAVLWLMIVLLMKLFWRYSHTATYLLIPYLMWVTYASTLNLGLYLLN